MPGRVVLGRPERRFRLHIGTKALIGAHREQIENYGRRYSAAKSNVVGLQAT